MGTSLLTSSITVSKICSLAINSVTFVVVTIISSGLSLMYASIIAFCRLSKLLYAKSVAKRFDVNAWCPCFSEITKLAIS